MLKFVLERPCSQSRAADNNRGYTYFQKHLRLISLLVHLSIPPPVLTCAWECEWYCWHPEKEKVPVTSWNATMDNDKLADDAYFMIFS